jgi:lipoyl(octanoyl) transferase
VRWRLILGTGSGADGRAIDAARGRRNMAVDHALLESVQRGGAPVLRLYAWEPACLSFGRNQHAAGIYDEARLRHAGLDVVRRPTGGLAVLHHRELTYCVLAPAPLLGGPRTTYVTINEALVQGLSRLGVAAAVAAGADAPDPRRQAANPCFDAPAGGEVTAGGRKLVGSAQRCEQRAILQHGSILLGGSQAAILELLAQRAQPVAGVGAVTIADILGSEPGLEEVAAAMAAGFEQRCGICLAPDVLTRDEAVRARQLEDVYGAPSWTWRR